MKISLLYTSARLNQIRKVIEVWRQRAANWDDIEMILVTDESFEIALPNVTHYLNTGRHDCVTGWNLAADKATGDMLVQVSDDLFPPDDWDTQLQSIVGDSDTFSLHLADERGLPEAVFHPVVSRSVYEYFGYLYPPEFRSMFCDNWLYHAHQHLGFLRQIQIFPFWNHVHRTTHDVEPDEVTVNHESNTRYDEGLAILIRELQKLGITDVSQERFIGANMPPKLSYYRRVPQLNLAPDGKVFLAQDPKDRVTLSPAEKEILDHCGSFVPLPQLQSLAAFSGEDFTRLRRLGFIESDTDIAEICASRAQPRARPAISDLGVITCDSPTLLRRAIESWVTINRSVSRNIRLIIVDDSPTAESALAQRRAAIAVKKDLGQQLVFVGPDTRQLLIRQIAETAGIQPELVEFALSGRPQPRVGIGASRNTLALLTQGRHVLSADDDVIAKFTQLNHTRKLMLITSAEVPRDTEMYESADSTASSVPLGIDINPYTVHEKYLGESAANILARFDGTVYLNGCEPELLRELKTGPLRIAVTSIGLVGDCASDCFAFYSMVARGTARARFLARAEQFPASREIRQSVVAPVLCQGVGLMTYCHAFDNTLMLPPTFPVGRGEDQVWQKLIHWMYPDTLVAHLPVSVLHRPRKLRTFSREDYLDPCPYFPGNAFLLGIIDSCPRPKRLQGPAERLTVLANYLKEITQSPDSFESLLRAAWHAYLEHHVGLVQAALADRNNAPGWLVDGLQQIMARLNHQLKSKEAVPLEYASLPVQKAIEELRKDLRKFADLLRAWPAIIEAAKQYSNEIAANADFLKP